MAQFLKYLILFVILALVIDLSIYLVSSDIIPLPSGNSQDNTVSMKNNSDSNFIKSILTELGGRKKHQSSGSSDGGLSISVSNTTQSDGQGASQGSQQSSGSSSSSNPPAITDSCLLQYNMTEHTIIFYYGNEPHSNAMIPVVQNLSSNYTFYQTQDLWNNNFNNCFGLSGITPTFVCARTKEKISGEMSSSALQSFASGC